MSSLPLVADWQRVTHRLLAALDAATSDLRLTAGETNALACFGPDRERTVRELLAATGQRPSTLTGVLDRLERRRLVERRPHPADRRSLTVALTPAGAAAAERVAAAFAALERELGAHARTARRALAAWDAVLPGPPAGAGRPAGPAVGHSEM
jgi:MarR family transcriptional regulator, organic hydroperoxide resistance regulator